MRITFDKTGVLVFFALIGLIFLTTTIHEWVHVIQAKEPTSICYDFGSRAFAHITHQGPSLKHGEAAAYSIQALVTIPLFFLLFATKKEEPE